DDSAVAAALEDFRAADCSAGDCVLAAIRAAAAGATLGELVGERDRVSELPRVEAISVSRAAAHYEKLVEKVRALGDKARIRQVNIGPSRRYRARADWTSAFFRAGGFKVLADDDFESVDAAARSLRDQPVRVAVLTA